MKQFILTTTLIPLRNSNTIGPNRFKNLRQILSQTPQGVPQRLPFQRTLAVEEQGRTEIPALL